MMDENIHNLLEHGWPAPELEDADVFKAPLPSIMSSGPRRTSEFRRSSVFCITLIVIGVAILLQVMIAWHFMSGNTAFDHPGTSGLDYPASIGFGVVYVLSFFVGSIASIVRKNWIAADVHVILLITLAICFSRQ